MIGAITGKVISPLMPYLLGGAVVSGLIMAGLLYWKNQQYDKLVVESSARIERAAANVARLDQAVTEQKAAIRKLVEMQKKEQEQIMARNSQLSKLRNSLDEERRKNDEFAKKWERVALARPSLLSRRINRATAKRVQFFTSATCRTDCDKDGDKNGGGKAAAETGTNSGG